MPRQKPQYNDSVYQQFWTADWSPDGELIAVGGVDSLLRIYAAGDLKLAASLPVNSWIHSVKWHPERKKLAIATLDKYILLWDRETGKMIPLPHKGGARAVGWNYDGQLLAVGDLDGVLKIWDHNGNLLRTIEKSYDPDVVGKSYLGLDWHPSKNEFVAINYHITLFDTAGHIVKVMEHPNKEAIMLCVKWHPSGAFFVIGDYGHNWSGENVPSLLHFWTAEGRLLQSVSGSKGEYRNISWNQKGTRLATASDVLRIWTKEGSLLYQGEADGTNYLWGIDWKDSGNKIVTASRHKTVALWDSTARLLKRKDVVKGNAGEK